MKKILSAVALSSLVLSATLMSCSQQAAPSYDARQDTVLTIEAPSVTAKAYPGVNYITWSVVPQAAKYELYRVEDGASTGTQLVATTNNKQIAYADIADKSDSIIDGRSYKYEVVAIAANASGAAVPSRAVYVKSNKGSASVTAKVPTAGTTLDKFDDSYTKDFLKKFSDAKQSSIVTFEKVLNGTGADLYANWPETAGFKFALKLINKSQIDGFIESSEETTDENFETKYIENYSSRYWEAAKAAGTYEAYLTIKSVSDLYPAKVVSLGSVNIASLAEGTETSLSAAYDKEGKNIILKFIPAILKDGTTLALENYTLYRAVASSKADDVTYTKVDFGSAVETLSISDGGTTNKAKVAYQFKDAVSNNTIAYTYVLTASKNGEYGKQKTADVTAFTGNDEKTATANASAVYDKEIKNVTVTWDPAILESTNEATPIANYKVFRVQGKAIADKDVLTPVTATITKVAKYDSTGNSVKNVYTFTEAIANPNVDYTYLIVHTKGTNVTATLTATTVSPTDKPSVVGTQVSKDEKNLNNVLKITVGRGKDSSSVLNEKQTLKLEYAVLDANAYAAGYKTVFDEANFNTLELKNNNVKEGTYISYVENAAYGTYILKLTASETNKKDVVVYDTAFVAPHALSGIVAIRPQNPAAKTDKKALVVDDGINATTNPLADYTYNQVIIELEPSSTDSNYVTVTSTVSSLELREQKIDPTATASSNDYVKYGALAGTTIYAVIIAEDKPSAKTGIGTITRTYYIQKILKSDTTKTYWSTGVSRLSTES